MGTTLIVLMVIVNVLLIITVLLQSGKDAGMSGITSGSSQQLFSTQKLRGSDLWLNRITIILTVSYFILAISLHVFKK